MPPNACILPWSHLVHQTDGKFGVCCKVSETITHNGKPASTLAEAWNSTYLQEMRRAFLNNEKPPQCWQCWQDEKIGKTSDRLSRLSYSAFGFGEDFVSSCLSQGTLLENIGPKSLDLKFSNRCNLKCRICSPPFSMMWTKEEADRGAINADDFKDHARTKWTAGSNDINQLIQWLPNIQVLEIFGGEPLLAPENELVLKTCIDAGFAERIFVRYNTNGTVPPRHLLSLWEKFHRVEVHFSLDDLGGRFEYQRKGAKWKQVEKNIAEFASCKSLNLGFFITVSVFNIYYLPELLEWTSKYPFKSYLAPLHEPACFSIRHLPPELKAVLKERLTKVDRINALIHEHSPLDAIIQYLDAAEYEPDIWKELITRIQLYDRLRNESFSDILPEFYSELRNHGYAWDDK